MHSIITLNGKDGVGKTQQIRLLKGQPGLHITKALKYYGDKWPKLNKDEEFEWWFGDGDFDRFLDMITDSLNKRNLDQTPGKITLHERGTLMFLAVCVAVLATRKQTNPYDVHALVRQKFLSRLNYSPDTEENIMLVADETYRKSIEELESRLGKPDSPYTDAQKIIYRQYQENLQSALDLCFTLNTTRIPVNRSIVDIQNEIRRILSWLAEIKIEGLCEKLKSLVCVGGLSESGKSLLCQNLHDSHGSYRLKLRYFSGKFGEDGILAEEILKFLQEHPHITLASVESLHNPELPIMFKKMFGKRVAIIYLQAPKEERARRHRAMSDAGTTTEEEFLLKDSLKESRGAHKVQLVADLVIDTSINTPRDTCCKVFGVL